MSHTEFMRLLGYWIKKFELIPNYTLFEQATSQFKIVFYQFNIVFLELIFE